MEDKIAAINARLKAAKTGVAVCLRGDKLSLRATLPPRPGSDHTKPCQQYIALGVYASPEGLKNAEAKAKRVGADLVLDKFDWSEYSPNPQTQSDALSVSEWTHKFEEDYFNRRKRTPQSETTWKKIIELPSNFYLQTSD